MFSEHKQIYFVLNNEGERYFLDSCLSLDSDDYLWYQLKKDGMKYVFFLERDSKHSVRLTVKDNDSFQKNTYDVCGIFAKKLWNPKKDDPKEDFIITVSYDTAANWMLARLQELDTAVVTDVDTLECMFSEAADQEKLITGSAQGKGTLVLRYPINPDRKNLDHLVGAGSIFRKEVNGQTLLKPLYAALNSGNTTAVFDELKKNVPEQCIEKGYINFDDLKVLMKNIGFSADLHFSENEFLDHVNYLFYWLENDKVRRDSGGLFGNINGTVTRKKLYDSLTKGRMSALTEREQRLRMVYRSKYPEQNGYVPLSQILFKLYGPKNTAGTQSHVLFSDPALVKLSHMEFPADNESGNSEFDIISVSKNEWDLMRDSVLKPRNVCFDEKKTEWIRTFLRDIESAKTAKDSDTLKRAVNMLMYCGNNLYAVSEEEFNDYCEKGKKYLDLSGKYFELKRDIIKYGREKGRENNILAAASIKAAEARCEEYFEVLKRMDTVLTQTQKAAAEIENMEFDAFFPFNDEEEECISEKLESYYCNEESVNTEKQKIDESIDQMSDEELLNDLKN